MAVTTPQPIPILPPAPNVTGPLARYLAHPGAETGQLLHRLGHLAAHLGVTAGPALASADEDLLARTGIEQTLDDTPDL